MDINHHLTNIVTLVLVALGLLFVAIGSNELIGSKTQRLTEFALMASLSLGLFTAAYYFSVVTHFIFTCP